MGRKEVEYHMIRKLGEKVKGGGREERERRRSGVEELAAKDRDGLTADVYPVAVHPDR